MDVSRDQDVNTTSRFRKLGRFRSCASAKTGVGVGRGRPPRARAPDSPE